MRVGFKKEFAKRKKAASKVMRQPFSGSIYHFYIYE